MTSQIERYAAGAGTPSGLTNPSAILAPGAATGWLTTPTNWRGKYLRWTFVGATAGDICYVRFSTTTAPTIDQTTATVVAANTLAASGVEPDLVLVDKSPVDDILDKRFGFFAMIGSAGGGKLYVQVKNFDATPGTSL